MRSKFILSLLVATASPFCAAVSISTAALPNGVLHDSYFGVITATGGCAPYSWKLTSGALPPGVTMKVSSSTTSVTLSGTPTKTATYSFTVSASGCGGGVAKASYKVVVQAGANHIVDLSWKASTTSDVVGYNVYRGPDGKSWAKIKSLAASTAYTDSTVANSSTYYYAATAVDINGLESKKSNIAKSVVP